MAFFAINAVVAVFAVNSVVSPAAFYGVVAVAAVDMQICRNSSDVIITYAVVAVGVGRGNKVILLNIVFIVQMDVVIALSAVD